MTQMTEDAKREMVKQKERLAILEESVDRKVETLEEEHFKLSRLQVRNNQSRGAQTLCHVMYDEIYTMRHVGCKMGQLSACPSI